MTKAPADSPKARNPVVVFMEAISTDARMEQFRRVETRWLSAERAVQILGTDLLMRRPELMDCTLASLLSCITTAIATGLEPGMYIHFSPFKDNGVKIATPIIDYKGLIRIVLRSPMVKMVEARVVYEGDSFDYAYGDKPFILHVPNAETADLAVDKATHVYSVVTLANGEKQREVMNRAQIEAVMGSSKAFTSEKGYTPWKGRYTATEMWRKTVVRRVMKYVPTEDYDIARAMIYAQQADGFDFEAPAAPPVDQAPEAKALPAGGRQDAFGEQLKQAAEKARQPVKVVTPAEAAEAIKQRQADAQKAKTAQGAPAAPQQAPKAHGAPAGGRTPERLEEISEEDIPF